MTFATILADCYDRLSFPSTPASAIATRIKRLANEAYREILALPGMMKLREDRLAITATANAPQTALPQALARLRGIVDATNYNTLDEVSLADIRARNPGRVNTGLPEVYAVVGWMAVANQPSAAAELFVKSTSASDTNTAYLDGIRSDGSRVSLSVAMTGTTAVSFGSTETAIVEVTKFYLSAAAVGNVTLNQGSGAGTELARISIGRQFARYLTVEWDPIPATTATLYADCVRNVYDLANDADEPLLPEDFHYLIPLRVRMKHYEKTDDDRYAEMQKAWADGTSALRSWVLNDGARLSSLRPLPQSFSSLGPMYPAGS